MKDKDDFSNPEQGKFYTPIEDIQAPIYLDQDVARVLCQKCGPENCKCWSMICYAKLLRLPSGLPFKPVADIEQPEQTLMTNAATKNQAVLEKYL